MKNMEQFEIQQLLQINSSLNAMKPVRKASWIGELILAIIIGFVAICALIH